MTVYVYITEQCKNDASRHGAINDIEKFKEKLENDQSARLLTRLDYRYHRRVMGTNSSARLVIEEYRTDHDTIVLCFVGYHIRSSADYSLLLNSPNTYYERYGVTDEEIEAFLKEKTINPIKKKPQLTEFESEYLQSASGYDYTNDGAFLESYDWVERISEDWAKSYLNRYHDLIFKLTEEVESCISHVGIDTLSHDKNPNIKIIFRSFPEHRRIFLIAPINWQKDSDEKNIREQYADLLTANSLKMEDLIRNSLRAYPTIIIYDEDIWMRVENTTEANLALSPEEECVLGSVKSRVSNGAKYPLFINGRPGSGKSTILQYLFAEQLANFIKLLNNSNINNPPLYLTYSTPLLEEARELVKKILTCGIRHVEDESIQAFVTDYNKLHSCFRNFREFLRSLLPLEIRDRFVQANYVDFARFRKLWEDKRGKHPQKEVRSIGPELGWHAVRTFIKGMQSESGIVVDPDYYRDELARDSKSISDQTFEIIYEHIWKKWYEPLCKNEKYWDDQDLALEVLINVGEQLSGYPAVFCDEAQDFTTIELGLIERLSVYSGKEIHSFWVKNVPFAFAGDPFQTLNPTGFNWSAMQSNFYDNIIKQLDPRGIAKLEFNFQELAFNYRSAEHIVKLANLIQLLRAVLLRIKGIRPQYSWTRKITNSPVYFRWDDINCRAKLREQDELVMIVPCQENGEFEYVKENEFLTSIAINQAGEISRNILSPARAKGLEYDRVVLYGFGDEAGKRFPDLLAQINDPSKDPPDLEQRLSWEYFLNQFYVAISRPRKRLFIVDSDESLKNFWLFTAPLKQKVLLSLYDLYQPNHNWSLDELGGMLEGDNSSWLDDRDDPLELASQWRDQGQLQRDPYLLRLAKDNFYRAERFEDASLCEAKQYEYEGEFKKAAELFINLGQSGEACRCYWTDRDANSVVRLVEKFPKITTDLRFIAAGSIVRERNTVFQLNHVLTALEQTPPSLTELPEEVEGWRWFFSCFADKISEEILASDRATAEWKPYIERLIQTIKRFELPLSAYPEIAKLLYLSGDARVAIDHWNRYCRDYKSDRPGEKWLTQARAETEAYPTNIRFYHELGDYQTVINQWTLADRIIDSDTPVSLLLDSAARLNDLTALRAILPATDDLNKLNRALSLLNDKTILSLEGALCVAITHSMESYGDGEKIIQFVVNKTTSNKELDARIKNAGIAWKGKVLIAAAVRAIARSERLFQDQVKAQKISEFLKQVLILEKDANPNKQNRVKSVLELIDITEAGAAFERGFRRLNYALDFYEQFFENSYLAYRVLNPSQEQTEFAKLRWIFCKRRLADITRDNKYRTEADNRGREWNISTNQKPDSLNLQPISELKLSIPGLAAPSSSPSASEITKQKQPLPTKIKPLDKSKKTIIFKLDNQQIKVEAFPLKKRIILTDYETQNQVKCEFQNVTSEDIEIKEEVSVSEQIRIWNISDWGLRCEMEAKEDLATIRFRLPHGVVKEFRFIVNKKVEDKDHP